LLHGYVKHIENYFDDYKKCYEIMYEQKCQIGFLNAHAFPSIEIEKPIKGVVVVGGYSILAKKSIANLKTAFPELRVQQFKYKL